MRKVAISQRIDFLKERNETRDCLDQRLSKFILETAGHVIPVPNSYEDKNQLLLWLEAVQPDALVLSGGNDIGEYKCRDQIEKNLLTYAYERALPLLGICRGMQMISVWAGDNLKAIHGHAGTRHKITGKLSREVNSFHKFTLSRVPNGFDALAHSEDGEIEAIQHQKLAWEGWMWHPERETDVSDKDKKRFMALLK